MWPITKEWREKVAEALSERGVAAEAARVLNCHPSAISAVLRPTTRQSRLVGPLSKHLGIDPPPAMTDSDPGLEEWLKIGRDLSPEEREELLVIARRFRK